MYIGKQGFLVGREPCFFTLDIVAVYNIDIPSKSPFGKGGLWSLRSILLRVIWVSNHPIPILLKAVPAGEQSFFCGSGWIGGVTSYTRYKLQALQPLHPCNNCNTVTSVTSVTVSITLLRQKSSLVGCVACFVVVRVSM